MRRLGRWFLPVIILSVLLAQLATAGTYYLTTVGVGAAQIPGNWNTGGTGGGGISAANFTTSGDVFIISSGQAATSNGTVTFGAGVTLQINGTLSIIGNGAVFTINGTIVFTGTSGAQCTLAGNGSGQTFILSAGATLTTSNSAGISGTNCSLPASGGKVTVTLNTAANYQFNGSATQATLGLPATVATLTINNSTGVTLGSATTVTTLTIGNLTSNSLFSDGGFQVSSTGTLNLTSGTFKLGGTAATTWPGFTARNISAGTTIEYASAAAQTISTAPSYQNLTFSGTGTKTTSSGTLAIGGNWIMGSATALNTNNTVVTLTGSLTKNANLTVGSGAISIGGNWTNNGGAFTAGTGTVTMNGTTGQLIGGSTSTTFNNLTVSGAADTSATNYKRVQTTMNVSGTLTISPGNTLDMGTLVSSTIANGTNSGKIRWAGSNVYVGGAGTTEFYGSSAATIAPGANYGNILILGSGANTIAGAVTAGGGTPSVGVTVDKNLTVTGTLTVNGMDLVNNGTITNNGIIAVQ